MTLAKRWTPAVLRLVCATLALAGCSTFDPPRDTSGVYASCCGAQGSCVPSGLLDAELAARLGQDSCGEDLLCAPTRFAVSPTAAPDRCHAPGGLEGRCLPSCLPEIAAQADRLQRGDCAEELLCLPCFDPLSGAETGACRLGGDRGPREAPRVFDMCCEGLGRCVPSAILETPDRDRLGKDSCGGGEAALCVPSAWLSESRPAPETCRAFGGGEGRCFPSCLPEVAAQSDRLVQGGCVEHALCLPCFDPRTGEDTGACRTEGDRGPREPPHTFGECCAGHGRCVPATTVPRADRAQLAADSCEGEEELCAPAEWIEEERPAPERCRAQGGVEGRCLLRCLPAVAAQGDRLERGTCADDARACVPCYDPLTGADSGACRIGGDEPRREPTVFAECCQGLGRCVPEDSVSEDDRARLSADSCAREDGALCVPSAWLGEERAAPSSCRAPGDLEGRCFPACLPEVAARADQLVQSNCAEHTLCLPCFDPLSGDDTGACRTPGDDGPREGPEPFPVCCGDLGRCVPRASVGDTVRSSLARDSCDVDYEALCVPSTWIAGDEPTACRAPGDLEGRCLPACVPGVAAQGARVQRGECAAEHACVPCFDPLTGADTTACRTPADRGPREAPQRFPGCCSDGDRDLGTCLPRALLPPEAQSVPVPEGLCDDDYACVPDALVRTPEVGLAACSTRLLGIFPPQPGACVPECLLGEDAEDLQRATCGAAERCVPCDALGLETPACD